MSARPAPLGGAGVWATLGVLALGFAACSWLVNPEKDAPRCSMDGGTDGGTDPCPEGSNCREGHCQVLVCGPREICGDGIDNNCNGDIDEKIDVDEMCNHADDDCDGEVDEGHDRDNDKFTWCGDLYNENTRDCDEISANVNPQGTEVCDGVDNNCNRMVDEPTNGKPICAVGLMCLAGRCIVPSCAVEGSGITCPADQSCVMDQCVDRHCNETMCPTGSYCDTASGSCVVPPTQRKNGEECSQSSDCESGVCIDSTALRLPSAPRRICAQACCKNKNCGEEETCYASGTGARSCLPRSMVGANKQCSHNDDCASTERCAIGLVPQSNEAVGAFGTGVCRVPGLEDRPFGEACALNESCASKVCVPDPLNIWGVCSTPCRVSSECTGLDERRGLTWAPSSLGPPHEYCRFIDLGQLGGAAFSDDYAAVCVMDYETGNKKFGESCTAGSDCQDGVCITGANLRGFCAPTCCTNAQCEGMDAEHPGARCVPMARGEHYEMRCTP